MVLEVEVQKPSGRLHPTEGIRQRRRRDQQRPPGQQEIHEGVAQAGQDHWQRREGVALEGGVKIFQPISPFASPHFRVRDKGGGYTLEGEPYGAILLGRIVSAYLQGSF